MNKESKRIPIIGTVRKKGSAFIWVLLFLIALFALTGVFLSYINSVQVYQSADKVVESIGKTRVQAVDIPLKEEYGHIEIINYNTIGDKYEARLINEPLSPGATTPDSVVPKRSNTPTKGYDRAIIKKDNSTYIKSVDDADKAAKESGLHSLISRVKAFDRNGGEGDYIKAGAENFCIEVFPLPENNLTVDANFQPECDVSFGGENFTISANVGDPINGRNHALSKNSSVSASGGKFKGLEVQNAVFVGFAYRDSKAMFYDVLSRFSLDNLEAVTPPLRTVYRIVYPQIDAHSFVSDGMEWDDVNGGW